MWEGCGRGVGGVEGEQRGCGKKSGREKGRGGVGGGEWRGCVCVCVWLTNCIPIKLDTWLLTYSVHGQI